MEAATITVRVVFWGLMAFVPNEEGERGLTALLADPIHSTTPNSHVPQHIPVVYLFKGDCEARPPYSCVNAEGVATMLGGRHQNLVWRIADQDLEIFGDEVGVDIHGKQCTGLSGQPMKAPQFFWQINDFAWVPSMERLTRSHGLVRSDCRDLRRSCPVHARFKVRGGTARACHLYHSDSHGKGKKRTVPIYEFKTAAETLTTHPIADGIEVRFQVEGHHVDLLAWKLPIGNDPEQQELVGSVRLRPAFGEDEITLIVANIARARKDCEDLKYCGTKEYCGDVMDCLHPHPHSDFLYNLLARKPIEVTRRKVDERSLRPGSCEEEISALAKPRHTTEDLARFQAAKENSLHGGDVVTMEMLELTSLPHSPTLCDGAFFQ